MPIHDESVKHHLEIDKYKLDEEWMKQAGLVYDYSILTANAELELDSIKLESEVLYAELDEEARLSFKGDKRPTESQIRQYIVRNSAYQELEKRTFRIKYNFNLMKGVIKALEHKKSSLEWMGRLFLANYYSEPYNPAKEELVREEIMEKLRHNPRLRRKDGDI